MQGGYMDDGNQGNMTRGKHFAPRTGLIPVTARIFNNLELRPDDTLEYKNNAVSDIVIVGYLLDYNEGQIQVSIKVWDGTGVVVAQFFNKNESEPHPGLMNFQYTGGRKLVRLFGHAKVFKKDRQFSGNKVVFTDDKDFQLHTLEVVHAWLNLTGKMDEAKAKEKTLYDESVKNLGKGTSHSSNYNNNNFNSNNNFSSNYSGLSNQEQMVLDVVKGGKKVPTNEILNKLSGKLNKDKVISTIERLCENGYVVEDGGFISPL